MEHINSRPAKNVTIRFIRLPPKCCRGSDPKGSVWQLGEKGESGILTWNPNGDVRWQPSWRKSQRFILRRDRKDRCHQRRAGRYDNRRNGSRPVFQRRKPAVSCVFSARPHFCRKNFQKVLLKFWDERRVQLCPHSAVNLRAIPRRQSSAFRTSR